MTVTGPEEEREIEVEVTRDYEEDEEPTPCYYVEIGTSLIYEVQFFPEFALVRPAHPEFYSNLERMDYVKFSESFEEFCGDAKEIRDFMWGSATNHIVVSRK